MRFEEALKNYLKTSDWKYQKSIDQSFDKNLKDPVSARKAFDQLSGLGTGNLGLAGIIRNPAMSKQLADPITAFGKILNHLRKYNDDTALADFGITDNYLSDGALNYLAKTIGKYYQHVGTAKDPMYKLIEKDIVNVDNLDVLNHSTPSNIEHFYRLKDKIEALPSSTFITDFPRRGQKLDRFYHNTSGEKKALEEYYDQSLLDQSVLRENNNSIDVFDFTKEPTLGGFVQSLNDMPLLVKQAIENKFLKDNSMSSNRLSLPDFMTGIARLKQQNNNVGLKEWELTKPILDVGDYEWHKLPYNIKAQLVEGRKMGNCVGDFCQAEPGYRDIYSLRWKETNTPKVNLSHLPWNDGSASIEQLLGVSNSTPKEKYYDAIQRLKAYLGFD